MECPLSDRAWDIHHPLPGCIRRWDVLEYGTWPAEMGRWSGRMVLLRMRPWFTPDRFQEGTAPVFQTHRLCLEALSSQRASVLETCIGSCFMIVWQAEEVGPWTNAQ